MALDIEIKVIVKKLMMDLGFSDEFEKTFIESSHNKILSSLINFSFCSLSNFSIANEIFFFDTFKQEA